MVRRSVAAALLLCLGLLCPAGCSVGARDLASVGPPEIRTEHVLFQHFLAAYGDKQPLLTGVNDINSDGREDLIVIYQDTVSSNKMIAIWEEAERVVISQPEPAPLENCRLEWRDIDDRDPIELIISGSKGVNVGYAIYRWQNGDFENLFGEGMQDCC